MKSWKSCGEGDRRMKRTQREKELLEKAARYLPGGSLGNVYLDSKHSFLVAKGKGSRVWDVSGNEYIDYLLGSGPMVLGHSHPHVVKAVQEALEDGFTFFATNEKAVELAEEIVRAVPCAEQVRFTTSGTEADFQALRICRAYRKRDKVLKFEGGFHGTSDYGWLSINPANPPDFPQSVPEAAGIPRAASDLVLVAPFNDIETTTAIIEKYHDELAAVIVEPVQRIIPPVPGFLQGLREVTERYQIPLVFDEIVTGFRLSYGGAQSADGGYGVVPDLCTLGKIVGGGFPLAAVAGREEIMRCFDPQRAEPGTYVSQVGTLSGNPVASVAGLATLEVMRRPGTYDKIRATGRKLQEALKRLFAQAEIPIQLVGVECLFDVYFTDQPITTYRSSLKADKAMLGRFNMLLLEKGILKGYPQKFYIGLCHTEEDVQRTIEAFEWAVERIRG